MNIPIVLFTLFVTILPVKVFGEQSRVQTKKIDTTELEQRASQLLEAGAVGFSLAMVNSEGVIWSKGYGYADLDAMKPMTTGTIQNIASVSKTLTGAAVMKLVETGQLDLDRDINHYLPFHVSPPDFPNDPITTRQLLTHTSAIIDREAIYNSELGYHFGSDHPQTLEDFLREYLTPKGKNYSTDNFNQSAPGKSRVYSNIAYGLVALVLENIIKEPLNEYTKKHLFIPLGMTSTGWMLAEVDQGKHAKLYEINEGIRQQTSWYGLATWPDGGARTSIDDFSKFFVAIINSGSFDKQRVLKKGTVENMLTVQLSSEEVLAPNEGAKLDYGQGLTWNLVKSKTAGKVIGHSGGDPGVTTHAYFDPNTKTGALLFINTQSNDKEFGSTTTLLLRALLSNAKRYEKAK